MGNSTEMSSCPRDRARYRYYQLFGTLCLSCSVKLLPYILHTRRLPPNLPSSQLFYFPTELISNLYIDSSAILSAFKISFPTRFHGLSATVLRIPNCPLQVLSVCFQAPVPQSRISFTNQHLPVSVKLHIT